ncbi:response regulator [Microbispora sp. RL4-1S]|uniref:Response regulator n=1 Tax=Microbispora oryzae TaxID=2806554 RepID=A0A941ASI8_9ACTN|nr:response regulator [Microbispora oryzae]MBP2708464.1 response regulator [Microbispora oryzae]
MPDRARVLLVDDREENLIALEAILSSLDVVPIRARSGEEALKALLSTDFALILLDVRMPGMDGFETAAHIKRRERTRNIPIIFLTVVDSAPDYAFRGYAAGAVDYLTKPFDPWVLRAKVAVFVELYTMNRRLSEQASLLRERLSAELPGADHASVLGELSQRIAAVEDELTHVRELAGKSRDTTIIGALTDLGERVAHLRAGFDALG